MTIEQILQKCNQLQSSFVFNNRHIQGITPKILTRWFVHIFCITAANIIPVALFRFADFVEGSPHLMPNEVSVHAQEYGLGGLLFDTDDEDDEEDDDEDSFMPTMKPE